MLLKGHKFFFSYKNTKQTIILDSIVCLPAGTTCRHLHIILVNRCFKVIIKVIYYTWYEAEWGTVTQRNAPASLICIEGLVEENQIALRTKGTKGLLCTRGPSKCQNDLNVAQRCRSLEASSALIACFCETLKAWSINLTNIVQLTKWTETSFSTESMSY